MREYNNVHSILLVLQSKKITSSNKHWVLCLLINCACTSFFTLGKIGCRDEKRGWWNGSTWNKVWWLSMLHTTCRHRPVAHVPVCGCKVCKNGICATQGKTLNKNTFHSITTLWHGKNVKIIKGWYYFYISNILSLSLYQILGLSSLKIK